MKFEVVIFLLVALFWVLRAIFRFFKWAAVRLKDGASGINALQQAPPPSKTPPPARTPSARPMPRQPQAGGPAVLREATERDFQWQEEELVASEPMALGTPLRSSTKSAAPRKRLFDNNDDLVRAIILREALGPPLSRRRPPTPP